MLKYIKVPIPSFPENGVISTTFTLYAALALCLAPRGSRTSPPRGSSSLWSCQGLPWEFRGWDLRNGNGCNGTATTLGYSRVKQTSSSTKWDCLYLFTLYISLHTVIFHFRAKKVTPCIRDAIALAELINICNVCVYVCISMYHVCISITISRCSARRSWQSAQRVLGSKAYGGSRLRVMGSFQRRRLRGYCQQHLIHPLIMSPLYQWQYELLMVTTMGT